jgi:hypothetical protein
MKPGAKNWNEDETPVISGILVTDMGSARYTTVAVNSSLSIRVCLNA